MFKNKSFHQIGIFSAVLATLFVSLFATLILYGQFLYLKISANDLIFQLLTLYLAIIVAVGLLSTFTSSKVEKELSDLLAFIKNAPTSQELLDEKSFDIIEFQELASSANAMMSEIRQNKELEAAKKSAEMVVKAQDRFIKSAIHEINTPLSIIRANIELLELKGIKNKHLTKIDAAAKIVSNIYDDLGYFVKKERYADKKEVVNISDFLSERVEYFMEIAECNNLTLEAKIEAGQFIQFDRTQLQRLIDNNIYNAIKYSSEGHAVVISLVKNDEKITFGVLNKSARPLDVSKIFDRYFRGDNPRGGFGIGLHLVQYICVKNSVTINAKNLEEGRVSFEYGFDDFLSSVSRMQGF
jgi:signal transduction histidine kinase